MKETQITAKILAFLKSLPEDDGFFWKTSDRYTNGVPDIVGVYRGCFVALEVKQPGKKATALQQWFLSSLGNAGAFTGVVHSVEEVEDILLEVIAWMKRSAEG